LDLVIGRDGSSCISDVAAQTSHHASDHDIITWTMSSRLKPASPRVNYQFRSLKNVEWSSFQADILSSELYTNPADNVDEFADKLDTVITEILDRHSNVGEKDKESTDLTSVDKAFQMVSATDRKPRLAIDSL
jgi:hypothetical protein